MKKVLALLSAALLFLTLFGCDLGNLGGDPVNPVDPVVPSDPLAVGSIVLTLTDPGVAAEYDDGIAPRAVITGAASNGCTFSTEVFFDETTKTVTINNLLAGTWNIKVKVWDDLRETDNYQFVYDEEGNIVQGTDSGKLEDVVALGYETALIVTDEETVLTVDLWTQDEMHALLDGAVYDTGIDLYDNSGTLLDTYYLPEDTDTRTPRAALTWGVYAMMAYCEEIVLDFVGELDPTDPVDEAELKEALTYLESLGDSATLAATLISTLDSAGFWVDEGTFVDMLNDLLDPDDLQTDLDANDFLSLIVGMYQTVDAQVVGDYEFLYYDFIDLEISGIAADYDGSVSVDLTVDPVYGSSLGAYTWYLNGTVIGTGTAFTLDPDAVDFVDGVNFLSVQYKYGTVILGTDEVWFNTEDINNGNIDVREIPFLDDYFRSQVLAQYPSTDAFPIMASEVLVLVVADSPSSVDLFGLNYMYNLNMLTLRDIGLSTVDDVDDIVLLPNLENLLLQDNPLSEDAAQYVKDNVPDNCNVYIIPDPTN